MEWSAGSVPNERIQQMDLKTWLEPTFPCIHTTLVAALCVYKVILHLPRVRRSLQKTTRRCENMLVICITIVLFSFDTTVAREQIQRSPQACYLKFHGDHSHAELIQTDYTVAAPANSLTNTAAQQV